LKARQFTFEQGLYAGALPVGRFCQKPTPYPILLTFIPRRSKDTTCQTVRISRRLATHEPTPPPGQLAAGRSHVVAHDRLIKPTPGRC